MPEPARRHYAFAGYRVDTQTRELRAGAGAPVALTAKAFDTLCYLIEYRGRVVGKDELLAALWPGRVVEENNLTQAVSALRHALGTGAGDHRYIVTVPGRGYRFVADVLTDAGAVAEPGPTQRATATHRPEWAVGALFALLAVAAALAWRWQTSPPPQAALAVLPFRALSTGPRDELLELGLAETLIARLSRSSALRVRTLASAQRAAGEQPDALAAGRALGAAYVIEGSTQRRGDHVRVNARLLTVPAGETVWADTFDERLDRAFTLQDGIARAVLSALALRGEAESHRSGCDGADAEAYRAYLTGHYLSQRPSSVRLPQALAAFRRAIDLDPTCARAYAGLAHVYRSLVISGDRDPRQMFPLARAAVEQALRIDPLSAQAHGAKGYLQYWYDWDWAGAEASTKRAIELNPSLAEAHFAYAHLLVNRGRFDEGLRHARQARELDPLSPLIDAIEAGFLGAARRPDEAQARLAHAFELEPDFWIALLLRGSMALDRHDYRAAIADLGRASERSQRNSQALAMLGVARAADGDRAGAETVLAALQARDAAGYVPASSLAAVQAALGRDDQALDLLERAYDERDVRLIFLKIDARWNGLRAQPRFRALARRLDLESEIAHGRY
ncbi:winged helix-turn-helix domain-containing protein [Lysobacter cavernae]|uniref:Winged helix-turn-helix domain-containing protein n=1 Tax=Lysobacter cavernae TaxID=1685901 RepID=A0ABV7RNZ9_9GAMM